jgi:phage terminase large subunit GpA-like protein
LKISLNNESSIGELLRRARQTLEPPERLKPSEWAPKRRYLSPESSSQAGGRFNYDLAPWQPEMLDAIDDPETGEMVAMMASQVTGKTETLNNIVGEKIDIDPCPMLMVQPTLALAEVWSKDRLATMLRDTPCLRGKVKDARSRDADNKILHKRFPGGQISIAGANSAASLAGRPIRIVFFDEVDRYPDSAGTEGDPIALAERRTESFPDAFLIKTSTPTIRGVSRIEKAFELSDKRFWFVEFPCCGHSTNLRWEMIRWQDRDPKTAHIECPICKAKMNDADRRLMVKNGKWQATAPFKGIRGYHMNGIYCLFRPKRPFKNRLEQMVAAFLKAKSEGKQSLKVWTNTFLAETWQEEAERIVAHELAKRAEDYGPDAPEKVLMIVAGTDVQRNRLEVGIAGVGVGEEIWGLEYRVFPGDPRQPGVWRDHDDFILRRKWKRADGVELTLAAGCVDSGDGETTDDVYKYTKPRFAQKIFATKGANQSAMPIVSGMMRAGRRRCPYYRLGTDTAKSTIYGRLKIEEHGPGYIHFPKRFEAGFDENYFAGLTSEELRKEYNRGRERLRWVKPEGARNEPLDIAVMWLAAIGIVQPNWNLLSRNLASKSRTYTLTPKNPETGADAEATPKEGEAAAIENAKAAQTNAKKTASVIRKPGIRPGRWGRSGSGFVTGWRKM